MKFPNESGNYVLKKLQTEHFRLTETFYASNLKQPRHNHSDASISLVLAGNYKESYGGKYLPRQSSTAVFHPPQESHAVYFENNVRILSVHFSAEKLNFIRRQSAVFEGAADYHSEKIGWLVKNIRREFQQSDVFSLMAIEGLILELVAETSRRAVGASEKQIPRWLNKAKDFLHDNFTETFSLEEISEIAGVHPGHLSRVFSEKFGCTIGEYIRRRRVEFAAVQIASTKDSLSEIALKSGFSDQSHLNKNFKLIFGHTPAEYRRKLR